MPCRGDARDRSGSAADARGRTSRAAAARGRRLRGAPRGGVRSPVWAQHPARDRHREPFFRRFFEGALASGGALTILDRGTDRIIGSSRYHGHDPARSEIEIGWTFLGVDCWGGAFNRDVKRQMLRHAFSFVDTVVFWVAAENH